MARLRARDHDAPPIPLDADLAALWPSQTPARREMTLLLQRARDRNRADGPRPRPNRPRKDPADDR